MKTRGIPKSLVLIGIFLLVFQWVMGPQALAGSVVGWGAQVTPTSQLACISAVSAGEWYSLALKADGSIVGWGDNYYGQATPPSGNDFVAVSAGEWHSLALKADGSIIGWGYNDYGQAAPPSGNDFVAVSAGWYHSLAIKRVLPPLEVSMNITPQTLNTKSGGKWVKAHITFPEEIYPEDIDINEPAIAYPMNIESESITVHGGDAGPVKLEVSFDRQAFCDRLTDVDDGSLEVTIIGSLTTGQYFSGSDTIRIIPRPSKPQPKRRR